MLVKDTDLIFNGHKIEMCSWYYGLFAQSGMVDSHKINKSYGKGPYSERSKYGPVGRAVLDPIHDKYYRDMPWYEGDK